MEDSLLKYKIGISLIPGIGSVNAKKLIAYTGGIEAVFKEKKRSLLKIPGIGEYLANQVFHHQVLDKAEKEVEFISKYGIKHYFYLDENYPVRLKNCDDAPIILFYKGEVNFNYPKIVSIVGTRNATDYGKDTCFHFVEELKSRHHEVLIVSGLAYGIDIAAHKAALKNGFPTIAVLSHGLANLYPAVHKNTAKEICQQGALVTDFVSDTLIDRNNFIKRNRIIAGLADVTVVVESALKGGALITADIAGSYNRDVMAFPGRITDPYSNGCNWLIKTNKASMIEHVADLEYLLSWDSPQKTNVPLQTQLFVEISEEEKKILAILGESGELSLDLISLRLNAPVSKISASLLNLEFAGMVRSLPGKTYRLS